LKEVVTFFKRNRPTPLKLPSRYLPSADDVNDVVNYLIFMTSIDHRAGPGFEDLVNGELLRGAELLWKLGELKWMSDRGFFNPARMARVSTAEVRRWLTTSGGRVAKGVNLRAQLLRDTAKWLIKLYGGGGVRLIEACRSSYARLVELLRPFRAFNDPVAKKAYLLAKLLTKSGFLEKANLKDLCIPVDNHVTRVSLRLGLIKPGLNPRQVPRLELDVKLRLEARDAWSHVVRKAGLDPIALDDLLWTTGRTLCKREGALCTTDAARPRELLEVAPWNWRRCPLEEVCRGYRSPIARGLKEPFVETWWY